MKTRTGALLALLSISLTLPASAQDGLRVPAAGLGIDPSLASGWFSPDYDRLGFAPNNWRAAAGFAPAARVQWTYPLGQYSLGMSMASGRDYESAPIFGSESRQYGLVGRYWISSDWSVNAEAVSREASTVFRLQDFRIGLRRQF
ncbi:MAG TPA: hypothetical protein VEB41_14500 [Burkholderiales bacterium]|nr:hypothetical protein [Burkholderiales bacterium]